jgi:hypothetical protein
MARKARVLLVTATAAAGVFASVGIANAATDSTGGHGVYIQGEYYGGQANAGLCNNQSSTNSYYLEIDDAVTGEPVAGGTTPQLPPGACTGWYWLQGYPFFDHPITVKATSFGNWTVETNPFYDN